jgi:ribulose-phosphate 3-epimerase
MSVFPGFGGQEFMPEVLPKTREIKRRLRADQRLEMDGGIHAQTITAAAEAGVDWFVIGSGIFAHRDRAAAIADLRQRIPTR